jgi:hypothetical protein
MVMITLYTSTTTARASPIPELREIAGCKAAA